MAAGYGSVPVTGAPAGPGYPPGAPGYPPGAPGYPPVTGAPAGPGYPLGGYAYGLVPAGGAPLQRTTPFQCPDKRCPAALCAVCREEADVPEHVLLRCPALAGARLRLTGSIYVDPSRLRDADLQLLAGPYAPQPVSGAPQPANSPLQVSQPDS
ncbi:hypothetical protein FJT64_026212 [Amphibalanus amphitrite]|uniref:Uncharacterized protein n=1 Tax=Amphibalanus amphitrite TaxID=1232801 RepID=A0A6A4WFC7_AMPAM|nr:hypothetical protein FJT64_026212 [Amphibalanus amphitrite]